MRDAGTAVHEDAAARNDGPGRLGYHGVAQKPETVAREKRAEKNLLNNADCLVVVVDQCNDDNVLNDDDGVLSVVRKSQSLVARIAQRVKEHHRLKVVRGSWNSLAAPRLNDVDDLRTTA